MDRLPRFLPLCDQGASRSRHCPTDMRPVYQLSHAGRLVQLDCPVRPALRFNNSLYSSCSRSISLSSQRMCRLVDFPTLALTPCPDGCPVPASTSWRRLLAATLHGQGPPLVALYRLSEHHAVARVPHRGGRSSRNHTRGQMRAP